MAPISYRRHRFPPVVIQHAVWLYLRFPLCPWRAAPRPIWSPAVPRPSTPIGSGGTGFDDSSWVVVAGHEKIGEHRPVHLHLRENVGRADIKQRHQPFAPDSPVEESGFEPVVPATWTT